jgi:zinc protease
LAIARSADHFTGAAVIHTRFHLVARRLVLVAAALLLAFAAPLVRSQSAVPSDALGAQAPTAPGMAPAAAPPLQKVGPILDRYEEAIGGRQAWAKLTSQVLMGTIAVPSMNLTGTIMVHEKAPNKFMSAVIINGAVFRQGFDGIEGWTDDPKNGLRSQTGAELAESARGADFLHAFKMRRVYTKIVVTGVQKMDNGMAWVVEFTAPEGGDPTTMYFDTASGLLLRVISQNHDADGVSKLQEDFDDYREVDGVKVPFVWRQTNADTTYTLTFSEVHHNVDLSDSEFVKPAAQ